ncbi:tyrosine protein kinase, partial [Exiguobacterium mexicanum]
SLLATPIYQANATLQYDKLGQVSLLDQMSDVMPFGNSNNQVDSEVEVIQSRMVLGKTVADLNLDTQAAPEGILNRLLGKVAPIDIALFQLPESLIGQPFTLTYLGDDQYSLNIDEQALQGKVGKVLQQGEISLLISSFTAETGEEFTLVKN